MRHFSLYKLLQYVRFNLELCSDWGGWVEWSHVLCPLLISSYPTPCSGRRHKDHCTDATAFLAGEESRSQDCGSCIRHYLRPVTWTRSQPTLRCIVIGYWLKRRLMECYAVSTGKQLKTFRRIIVNSPSWSRSSRCNISLVFDLQQQPSQKFVSRRLSVLNMDIRCQADSVKYRALIRSSEIKLIHVRVYMHVIFC